MKKVFFTFFFIAIHFVLNCQIDFNISLGEKTSVNRNHLLDFEYLPDGHISVVPELDGTYSAYWSMYRNCRTIGQTPFLESQSVMQPNYAVFGGRESDNGTSNGVDDGGAWLMSVFRRDQNNLIGFYHGESHWYPRNGDYTAWKSTCVVYSNDNGFTWVKGGQIITSNTPKPNTRAWGGTGDCSVVWDSKNKRWNCYYQEHWIKMAVSYDPLGAPGTWKKYYKGGFTEQGLGGLGDPLPNISTVAGTNPSVHWNTYLNKWVMVYYNWGADDIYITVSDDGVNWTIPEILVDNTALGNVHPTIIGETDVLGGKSVRLYYGENIGQGKKNMVARDLVFERLPLNDVIYEKNIGFYPNPVEEELVINFESNFETLNYTIYTMDGKVCREGILTNNKIGVSDLDSNNFYLIKVFNENIPFRVLKFLKK